jgi:hypothetical protein
VLSRCQSPTRPHGQDRAAGVGTTSAVLAEMGQVLSHMDTLIAGDTAAGPAGRSGGSSGSSWGRGLEPGRHQPGAAVGGVAQSPSALVYKLVKGAGSTAGAAAGATPAAERRAGHAAAAVGLGQCTQQMLVTPHGATGSSQVSMLQHRRGVLL